MQSNDLFEQFQTGFRSKHSTETALVKVKNVFPLQLIQSILILLDISAAFGTISHSVLLKRFACIGVADDALWISSYLSNSKQFVQIKNAQSESATVTQGVPQGSVLGLLHFIIRLLSNLLQLYIPSRSLRSSNRVIEFQISS